jgi:hypothetical protein
MKLGGLGSIGKDIGVGVATNVGTNLVQNALGGVGSAFSGGVQSAETVGSDLLSGNIGGAVMDGVKGIGNFFGNLFGIGGGAPAAQPFSPPSGGGDATGGAGGAGGFGGNFNSLASGADPNNANSLLGIQTQADQQQTLLELAAKLEAIQKETDQFIIQNL